MDRLMLGMGPDQYQIIEPVVAAIVQRLDVMDIVAVRHLAEAQGFEIPLGKAARPQFRAPFGQKMTQKGLPAFGIERLAGPRARPGCAAYRPSPPPEYRATPPTIAVAAIANDRTWTASSSKRTPTLREPAWGVKQNFPNRKFSVSILIPSDIGRRGLDDEAT